MPVDNNYTNKAINIISQYFGSNTANLYNDYYKDKDTDFIKKSLTELLTDVVGATMTAKIIQEINL
jgi:hypothetical protein